MALVATARRQLADAAISFLVCSFEDFAAAGGSNVQMFTHLSGARRGRDGAGGDA